MPITLPELLKQFNTTAYKRWENIIQIKHYATGIYHYFDGKSLQELPITSIRNIFEEN